ncbi:HEAT repeat domain-containing protein [Trichloromonas sp.]|uniref:HEAT repeat domain-containing protein n=1 Tax=Trichloromonas sp. TaxID=3069249 RepID=UPI002A3A0E1B|nr:HEAT repeat domain-containing protein [Trichloromonas sp.]
MPINPTGAPLTLAGPTLTTEYLESALRALDVLLKATRFYPPGHPALKTAVEQALLRFAPMLMGRESILFTVHKEGFRVDDTPLSTDRLVLKNFAVQLFARHVRSLMVLTDLSARDLHAFSRCLTREPGEIQEAGGVQALLKEAGVTTIWVNEIDLSAVLTRKEEIESLGPEETLDGDENEGAETLPDGTLAAVAAAQPEQRDLEELLRDLEQTESDQHFAILAQELQPAILAHLHDQGANLVIRALQLLRRYGDDPRLSPSRRSTAQETLGLLARDDLFDFLIHCLCHNPEVRESRERLLTLIAAFPGKIEEPLMRHLAAEGDSQARKVLGTALVRLGATAASVLIGHLKDPRWFVVRNVMVILGEIRDQQTTAQIVPLLNHEDIRVRRETLRALTKIGGRSAENNLIRILESDDGEMRRQAILSLGALKSTLALPALTELASRKESRGLSPEERKEVIVALGQIGSGEVLPCLGGILKRRRFWFGGNDDELREAAAEALGKICDDKALTLLENAVDDRSPAVARAARLALNRLEKALKHAT